MSDRQLSLGKCQRKFGSAFDGKTFQHSCVPTRRWCRYVCITISTFSSFYYSPFSVVPFLILPVFFVHYSALCEYVQHLAIFDYICVAASSEGRVCEWVSDDMHEHFEAPARVHNAHYVCPTAPGYSSKLKQSAIRDFEYPNGNKWQEKLSQDPMKEHITKK